MEKREKKYKKRVYKSYMTLVEMTKKKSFPKLTSSQKEQLELMDSIIINSKIHDER